MLIAIQDKLMKTVNVLLASGDRRTNNFIQTIILDVCYNRAAVNCLPTARVDELLARGGREGFDLIILSPDHLVAEPSRRSRMVNKAEVAQAIGLIKRQRPVPVIAVAVSAEDELPLSQAGADGVLGVPFDGDALRREVQRLLPITDIPVEPEPVRGSLAAMVLRGLHLLKSA